MNESIKARWSSLPANARTLIAIGGLFSVMVVGAMALGVTGNKKRNNAPGEQVAMTNLTLPSRSAATVEQVVGRMDASQDKLKQLEQQLQKGEADRIALLKQVDDLRRSTPDNTSLDVAKEVLAMRKELETLKSQPAASKSSGTPSLDDPLSGPVKPSEPQKEAPTLKVLVGEPAPASVTAKKAPEKKALALTAGSFFEGVLINGMDAPTSSVTVKNPVPAVIRVKTEAILPNSRRTDVRECFAVISGYGVLASERAVMRTETITCILDNDKIVESKVEGWIVGEDGKVGMRGRLVSKQGQIIAKALVGSSLAGIGSALTPTAVPQLNLNPSSTQTTQTADFGTAAESGVLKGFADTSKMIAQFYLDMAKEMFPVIEIDAGRKVTVMLIKGFELKE